MDLDPDTLVKAGTGAGGSLGFLAILFRYLKGDLRRVELEQSKTNSDLYAKVAELAATVTRTELDAAKNYVRQTDFMDFRNHIDQQFVDQRNFFMDLLRSKA